MRIIDFFDKGVSLYPDNLAFVEPDSRYTYTEAAIETHTIASAINGRGYLKNSRVGILAPNSNIAFLALLGLMRAEAVWLPINPRNTVEVNIDLLDRFEGELLFYHSKYETEAREIQASVPGIRELVLLDGDGGAGTPLSLWVAGYTKPYEIGLEEPGDLLALFPTGGTTGKPKCVMMTHKAILDDDGNEVPRGERGEICVKSDLVTPGYFNNPEATAEVRAFGWHHTGDIGIQDDEGFIRIVDRKKDMIISGGFNVYPNEIEQALMAHPAVEEVFLAASRLVPDEMIASDML